MMPNTPNIRFKEFADDWEQCKFGDIADYKKGPFGSALKKDIFVPRDETTVKVYEQQNAINKDWTLERYFVTEEYAQKLSGFKVVGGDIIVSCAGTIGETYELPTDAEPGIINQALMKIKVDESIIDKKMFIILFTNMIDDFTRVHSNGSAIKNIPPFSDLKPMEVLVPEIDEQKKISEYFSNLDNLITLHQRKCDEVRQLKKFMLQKMFPKSGELIPEIRFAEFTDAWEQRKLSEVLISLQNNTLSRAELSTEKGVAKSVHYGDILVKFREVLDVSDEQLPMIQDDTIVAKYKTSFLQNGDVIIADTAEDETVGKCTEIAGLDDETVISGLHTIPYRPIFEFASGYLGYYMNSTAYHSQLLPFMQGIKVTSISKSAMQNTDIVYPKSVDEQKQIGDYFRNLDHLITLHQQKCDELKEVKRFMLQNMFPQKG